MFLKTVTKYGHTAKYGQCSYIGCQYWLVVLACSLYCSLVYCTIVTMERSGWLSHQKIWSVKRAVCLYYRPHGPVRASVATLLPPLTTVYLREGGGRQVCLYYHPHGPVIRASVATTSRLSKLSISPHISTMQKRPTDRYPNSIEPFLCPKL